MNCKQYRSGQDSFKALGQYFSWKEWGELTKIPVSAAAYQATTWTQDFCSQSKGANYSNNSLQKNNKRDNETF